MKRYFGRVSLVANATKRSRDAVVLDFAKCARKISESQPFRGMGKFFIVVVRMV
jgi:hypothetical protein